VGALVVCVAAVAAMLLGVVLLMTVAGSVERILAGCGVAQHAGVSFVWTASLLIWWC
jgi:hypothetical protein